MRSTRLTGALGAVLLGCVGLASCGPVAAPGDPTGEIQSAIEDGTVDTTHTFAVGIVQLSMEQQTGEVAFCSGVLLGPNLVATARHCVSNLSSAEITCGTSTFGSVVPAGEVLVTPDTTISPTGTLIGVSTIVVPSGANQTGVCGDDIALLILAKNITLPQYVTPVISPPMTDPMYGASVTAIGYGVTTPTDTTGATAGERRIKENIKLLCIPDDTHYTDCFSDPIAKEVLASGEFISGDASTCEGDSGSGAYDQAAFDRGQWLAFGVLSRGAISADGGTCIEPIYTRFDQWGALLMSTAQQAAAAGQYAAPAWALGGDAAATTAGGLNSGGSATGAASPNTQSDGSVAGGASNPGESSDVAAKASSSGGCSVVAYPGGSRDGTGVACGVGFAALGLAIGRARRAGRVRGDRRPA